MWEKFRSLPRSLYFLFAGTIVTRMGAFVFPYLTIYLSEERGYGFHTIGDRSVRWKCWAARRELRGRHTRGQMETAGDASSRPVAKRRRILRVGNAI